MNEEAIRIRVLGRIGDIAHDEWDACAGTGNPFLSHAFLNALEESGSVSAEEGWLPQHLVVEGADGRPDAVAPFYLKSHSYGEYVFDHSWAHAYESAGGQYYPKLVSAVPFTPVPGPRLLIRPGADRELAGGALIAGMIQLADQMGASSVHVNFPRRGGLEAADRRRLRAADRTAVPLVQRRL